MITLSRIPKLNNYIFKKFCCPPPVKECPFFLSHLFTGGFIMDDYLKLFREMISLRGLTDHTVKSYSTYIKTYDKAYGLWGVVSCVWIYALIYGIAIERITFRAVLIFCRTALFACSGSDTFLKNFSTSFRRILLLCKKHLHHSKSVRSNAHTWIMFLRSETANVSLRSEQ